MIGCEKAVPGPCLSLAVLSGWIEHTSHYICQQQPLSGVPRKLFWILFCDSRALLPPLRGDLEQINFVLIVGLMLYCHMSMTQVPGPVRAALGVDARGFANIRNESTSNARFGFRSLFHEL